MAAVAGAFVFDQEKRWNYEMELLMGEAVGKRLVKIIKSNSSECSTVHSKRTVGNVIFSNLI